MSNDMEFRVQYLDGNGVWCNIYRTTTSYSEALDRMIEEAKKDPEYNHRIVRTEVLGYITGGDNINE